MKTFKNLAPLAGLLVVILALAVLSFLAGPAPLTHADTVPTPSAAQPVGLSPYRVTNFLSAASHAADTNSSAQQLVGYKTLDLQYVIDQPTSVNTLTLTLQWSNDGNNWSDGPAIVSANAADADGMVQITNMGRYTRISNNVTNTGTVSLTVIAVAH